MVEIDTLFQTKMAKNHNLWLGTYLYSLYKGLPPHPVRLKMHCRLWVSLLTKLEPMREKTSLVNDWLSPNSLNLVRKASGDKLVFLWRKVLERLWNSLECLWTYYLICPKTFQQILFYYGTPTKNPDTLRIKNDMSINLKKLAVDICIHWFHF